MALEEQDKDAQALDGYRQTRAIMARLKEQSPNDAALHSELAWLDERIAALEHARSGEPGPERPEQAAQ